jgi:hypothetical protein
MAQRTYEGDPIDGTMQHLAERDLNKEAEDVEVPSDESHEGGISTEYGFLDDETLSKAEKVERLWRRSDYDFDQHGSSVEFYEETVSPVLHVSKPHTFEVVRELKRDSDGERTENQSEQQNDESQEEVGTDSLEDVGTDVLEQSEVYSREEIEHGVLKPLVFAQEFASGDELEALEEAEELVEILLNKGDQA